MGLMFGQFNILSSIMAQLFILSNSEYFRFQLAGNYEEIFRVEMKWVNSNNVESIYGFLFQLDAET